MTCRKAFTFAEGFELTEKSWEELAVEDMTNHGRKDIDSEWINMWIEAMQELLRPVRLGGRYVIIDWQVFSLDEENISFDGMYAKHAFQRLPQFSALKNSSILDLELGNSEYWRSNKLPEEY